MQRRRAREQQAAAAAQDARRQQVGPRALGMAGHTLHSLYLHGLSSYSSRCQQCPERAAGPALLPQVENVQRMIEEKRQRAAAARRPFLVVHPGACARVPLATGGRGACGGWQHA